MVSYVRGDRETMVLSKSHPRIAIIGSANESRNDDEHRWPYHPPLQNADQAQPAAEAIGRELFAAGWDVVIYSGEGVYHEEGFIEPWVVRGFLSGPSSRKKSVHVYHAQGYERPTFSEEKSSAHRSAFSFSRDSSDDWEPSFYRSLAVVDAAFVLGGGHSSYLAGLVCIGRRIPVLALDAFGAAGSRVYQAIVNAHVPLTDEDKELLGEPSWTPTSAKRLVESLKTQQKSLDEEREEYLAQIRQRRRSQSAGVALGLFLIATLLVPTALVIERADTWFEYALLFTAPVISGMSGGTIRTLLPRTQSDEISTLGSAALGAVAGGIAGLIYIVSQITSTADTSLSELTGRQYQTWVLFAVVIGFVSGLALDAVFQRLVKAGEAQPRDL